MEAATTALGVANDSDLRVPCYCEENVWRLAYRMLHGEQKQEDLQYHVVFVSNPQKCCLFLYQRCNDDPFDPCFWDYHVILLCTKSNDMTMVQDIDSHLPYKISLKDYLKHVFPTLPEDAKRFSPYFRVVDAACFLERFASDRMHMYNPETKQWSSTPPKYACIQRSDGENNLTQYMTISEEEATNENKRSMEDSGFGAVYTLPQLKDRFHIG